MESLRDPKELPRARLEDPKTSQELPGKSPRASKTTMVPHPALWGSP